MPKRSVVIFFSIVLSLYALINAYLFFRGWEVLPREPLWRSIYTVLFILCAVSFIAGRMLERFTLSWIGRMFVWIGSLWLATMVYLLLFTLSADIVYIVHSIVRILPVSPARTLLQIKQLYAAVSVILSLLIVAAGFFNARWPHGKVLHLTVSKNSHPIKSLNIVVVSDIHLGTIINRRRLEKIVSRINKFAPDLVLLPGDVFDEDIGPVIQNNLGETLRKIKAVHGVIAITGNHEYFGGVDAACRYLADHGITVLRDSSVKIGDSVYVVGREDSTFNRINGQRRKPLRQLLEGLDSRLPIIVMDHQPFHLDEAMENRVDLQVSGHTHHGQLWPFNFITKKVYELSWGYKKKKDTHFYVSCGVGTWGPPVRTGNRPEIVNIHLNFE